MAPAQRLCVRAARPSEACDALSPLQPIRRADSLPLRRARTLVILILGREQTDYALPVDEEFPGIERTELLVLAALSR